MERGLPRHGVWLLALALLGGCGGLGKSAEDRINAVRPVSSTILVARDELLMQAKAEKQDIKSINDDYAARLKVRALECGHGYAPGMFTTDDDILANLTDKECFTKADQQLQQWLGMRRIGLLLAAAPLRPLPKTPASMIVAEGRIGEVAFAERAGIAVVQSNKQYQVLDIGSGDIIHQGNTGTLALAPSPNGRLFVVDNQSDASVMDAETGAVLATFPAVKSYQFHWVHDIGAVYTTQGGGQGPSTEFVDFTSGRHTTIPMSTDVVSKVFPLPGTEPRFALFGWGRFGQLGLKQEGSGWTANLVSEHVLSETTGWSRNMVGLTADGKTIYGVGAGHALQLMPLSSLQLRSVELAPLRLQSAVATPNLDELLLSGYFSGSPGFGADYYLYSISHDTLAKVDTSKLLSKRLLYIPALHKNAVIDNSKIVLIDAIPAEPPIARATALQQRQQELAELTRVRAEQMQSMPGWGNSIEMVRARALARMQASNSMAPEMVARMLQEQGITPELFALAQRANELPDGAPRQAHVASVPGVAKDAEVEAIGVYQGGDVGQAHGASQRTGTVQVRVRRSAHPLVLSLSAYEPVRWVLTLDPGAKLAMVLSSGYSEQEVLGAGAARVIKVGQTYAYKRGSAEFNKLDDEVSRLAGKRIGVFQGGYAGSSYTVGN